MKIKLKECRRTAKNKENKIGRAETAPFIFYKTIKPEKTNIFSANQREEFFNKSYPPPPPNKP